MQDRKFSLKATFFVVLLCTIFGASVVAMKVTFSGIGPFTAAGFRFSIASTVIIIWALATGRSFKLRPGQWQKLVPLGIIFIVHLSTVYLGLDKTNASRASLLINIQPFFVLILAHFFIPNDRITKNKIFSMLLGFCGLAFVFLDDIVLTTDMRTGDLLVVMSALLWAFSAIYTKRIIDDFRTFHLVLYPMLFGFPCFFLEGYLWDNPMITYIDPGIIFAMFYQSVIAAAFGYFAWNLMLRRYGATALHSFVFIMPVSGVLFSGLILNEPVTWNILVALLLIAAGIWLLHFKRE